MTTETDWEDFVARCDECRSQMKRPFDADGGKGVCPKCNGRGVVLVSVRVQDLQAWAVEKILSRPAGRTQPTDEERRAKFTYRRVDEGLYREIKKEKVETGTGRLDDLLLGGVPFGSNILLHGDSFSGKEILAYSFVADGLKKGVPAVVIMTKQTREEFEYAMRFVLPEFDKYTDLVYYIDAYSYQMGVKDPFPNVVTAEPTINGMKNAFLKVMEMGIADGVNSARPYYRLVYQSLSTPLKDNPDGVSGVHAFMIWLAGRVKAGHAVGMYLIEKGMHDEQFLKMVESTMAGTVEFSVTDLISTLQVKGVCDAQSRAKVRYDVTKAGVTIGSFSLEGMK